MKAPILAVVVRAGAATREFVGTDLKAMQALVAGYVEHVTLRGPFQNLHMWVNEQGLLNGLPLSRCPMYPWAPIAGDYFVTRMDAEGDPTALNEEDVALLLGELAK